MISPATPSAPSPLDGREALALYAGAPWTVRLHVRLRWWTCPFPAIAAVVPTEGRVLEVGCGFGLFSGYLALGSRGRVVRGIDVDERKIRHARAAGAAARSQGGDLDFAVGAPGELPAGPWDVIVVVDVLYLLDDDAQRALLEAAAALLPRDGVLVVKEMAFEPRWKLRWTAAQETVSVRWLGVTKGERLNFAPPNRLAHWMGATTLEVEERPLHRGYPYPHHLLVGTKPAP